MDVRVEVQVEVEVEVQVRLEVIPPAATETPFVPPAHAERSHTP
jgi:hypothetical protein